MAERVQGDSTYAAHLRLAAKRGNVEAQRALQGPPMPRSLRYLRRWVYQLHGRSGVGMGGLAPLSYREIEAWSRLTGIEPDVLEVEALLTLDAAMRHRSKGRKTQEQVPRPAWPTRKA